MILLPLLIKHLRNLSEMKCKLPILKPRSLFGVNQRLLKQPEARLRRVAKGMAGAHALRNGNLIEK